MKIGMRRYAFVAALALSLAVVYPTKAAFVCPEGFTWSRETVACEQTTCPPSSHRNYTLECICDNPYDVATYEEIGLLESCSAGKPDTNSAGATPPNTTNATEGSDGNVNTTDEPPVIQPTPDEELTAVLPFVPTERQEQFRQLMQRYRESIPRGVYGYGVPGPYQHLFSPGQMNNLVYGANANACGGYQDQVLKWLLSLYFSNDPSDAALLDGFDFGPIQITKGAHQAVVIFPKGTDWRANGIVLDPWPEQTPRLYTIDAWDGMFLLSPAGSTGNFLTPIDSNTGKFPTTPAGNGNWEYDDVYTAGARRSLNVTGGGRRVAVRSPVDVVVTDGDRSVGVYSDSSFVNDFGTTIEGYVTQSADGTSRTGYTLPDGTYGVVMTATGEGDVHVYAGTDTGVAIAFETVTVSEGDQLVLGWEEADTQPALFDANAREVASAPLDDLEPPVPVVDTNATSDPTPSQSVPTVPWSWISVGLVALALLSIGLGVRKRRQ